MSSMDRFKQDYPEVFEKFLEMNRALAELQRRSVGAGPPEHEPRIDGQDFPNMLELD